MFVYCFFFLFSSRRRHTRCSLVTGVQTCALPISGLLLAERVPDDAHILVLGAGGGSEMKAMAEAHPGWRFTGVDPAGPMLDLAAKVMGPNAHRADQIGRASGRERV